MRLDGLVIQTSELQVAARVGTERLREPVLLGLTGKPVVKMFVFAPSQCYDFTSQVCAHTSAWDALRMLAAVRFQLRSHCTNSGRLQRTPQAM